MKTPWIAVLALLLPAGPASAQLFGGCEHRAERSAAVPAAGAERLLLAARAGSLRVEGRAGLDEVRVRGTACASSAEYLEGIELFAEASGGEVRVEARLPETRGFGRTYATLDLVVEVPQGLPLEVDDSSGEVEIRDVAALRLRDSSGGIDVSEVAGDVEIDDSSGDLRLRGVRGSARLRDSSGGIDVSGVEGSVLVGEDGSGDIEIRDVARDVRVDRDSSGSISVSDVRGDFVVERDGSGGIRYREVAGAVSIPERKR